MSAPCEAVAPARAAPVAPRGVLQELTAELVAAAYLRDVTAFWQGASSLMRVRIWLERYWHDAIEAVPAAPPAAVSPHGGGGRGIWWYETDDTILGYIPGCAGGYLIPRQATMPGMWETVSGRSSLGRRTAVVIEGKAE